MTPTLPVDAAARERVRSEHGTGFVLVAGAGTGKTTLLIDRIEALVLAGVPLPSIAAATFTENAATTLKLRLRERLERARATLDLPVERRTRAAEALDTLEIAPLATIHALCAAILSERPLDCGVTPGFRVADESTTELLFSEAWDGWLVDQLADGNSLLMTALDRDIPLEGQGPFAERASLRGLARRLVDHRDLKPIAASAELALEPWRDEILEKAAGLAALLVGVEGGDLLATRLAELTAFAEGTRFLAGDALAAHLERFPNIRRDLGQKRLWPDATRLAAARAIAEWAASFAARLREARGGAFHARLVQGLGGVVQRYQQLKTARGLLDFLDLLVATRNALRDKASVRRDFRDRFRHVIVDEFQDTDPLQFEIVDLLTRGRPGALVVVGDPKQSIYRFRRADVALLDGLARAAEADPQADLLHLTQSFRARPALLRFVNRVFARLIEPSEEAAQTRYDPIDPPPGLVDEPSVLALTFPAPELEGEDLLEAEAAALAALLAAVARGELTVRDPSDGHGRPSRAGDVMVLVRRLTKIVALEEALERAGVRFVVEGGKSFFDRQEVHETLAILRAIDDPGDTVSLVAALRSTFLAVSDRDLAAYALSGGRLQLGSARDTTEREGSATIIPALRLLARYHAQRTCCSVPALIESLLDETRVLAALVGSRRGEAQAANLEKTVALAREAAALGVLTLRGFNQLLAARIENGADEPDLPATRAGDPAVVRLLTIHKAKGLEAPVVATFDLPDDLYSALDVIALRTSGEVAIGFREGCQPPGWAELKKREEARSQAEGRRLLYVACTRARDYLILPRPTGDPRIGAFWRDLIASVPRESTPDVRVIDVSRLASPPPVSVAAVSSTPPAEDGHDLVAERWDEMRRQRLEAAAYRPYLPTGITRHAASLAPVGATREGPRETRAFGVLVHRLLEWATEVTTPETLVTLGRALATGRGLDEVAIARAVAAAQGVIAHPLLQRARAGRAFRELRVWLPEEGRLLEGIVDLVFEEADGLVLVDYKTDPITETQALEQAAHHAPQVRLYARALTQATGLPVRERYVLFTALGRAVPV